MFGQLRNARDTLEALARVFDADALSGSEAVRAAGELAAIRRVVDGMVAKAARRIEDVGAHTTEGERNAASMIARTLGVGTGEVRTVIDTARRLESLPATDAAVRRGSLSSRQAQLVAVAAKFNPAAELEAADQGMTALRDACVRARADVEEPEPRSARQRSFRSLRTWTDTDGMFAGSFRLTPEIGGQVKAALDAHVQKTFRKRRSGDDHEPLDAYAADALAAFVLGDEGVARGVKPSVHIVIDRAAVVRGEAVEGERCEIPGVGPVNVDWVRELLGTAFVTAVIKKGKDITTVAHLGRHIPAEIRTALLVSGRECDADGCDCRGYLEIDHTVDYARGGPTAWWNLKHLCAIHHRLKTLGWTFGSINPKTGKRKLRPSPARAA